MIPRLTFFSSPIGVLDFLTHSPIFAIIDEKTVSSCYKLRQIAFGADTGGECGLLPDVAPGPNGVDFPYDESTI